MFNENKYYDKFELSEIINKKLIGSFLWMGIGLIITFSTVFYSILDYRLLLFSYNLLSSNFSILFLIAFILLLSFSVNYANSMVLKLIFIAYSAYLGLVLVPIIYVYELSSIFLILSSTGILFILISLYGYFTKDNLQSYNRYLFFGLLGIIIVSLLNTFIFKLGNLELLLTFAGLAIFLIYVAVDTQRIKMQIMESYYMGDKEILKKVQIVGAIHLYLDFINIFIRLLSLFGKKRN